MDNTSVGKKIKLVPTQGCYQLTLYGEIVSESRTRFTVDYIKDSRKKVWFLTILTCCHIVL